MLAFMTHTHTVVILPVLGVWILIYTVHVKLQFIGKLVIFGKFVCEWNKIGGFYIGNSSYRVFLLESHGRTR